MSPNNSKRRLTRLGPLVLSAAVSTALATTALAAPSTQTTQTPPSARPAQANKARPQRARAWLRLDTPTTHPWIGQAVPVTVAAYFRDVDGVTLEGAPQLTSKAIMTSDLAREPHQSTEIVDGERVLVARWSGTVTPSTAGPLDLVVELPVRIRYREAPARAPRNETQARPDAPDPSDPFDADPFGGDPFAGFGNGASIDDMFARMQRRMQQQMQQAEGPTREQALPLKATIHALDVRALPTEHRPASFSGAVGHFDLDASVSSTNVHASDPVTVRVAVTGSGDLDRVDLPGIQASDAWKAYPPHVVTENAPGTPAKGPPRKIFEQVLVPLHGGDLAVPPVSLTSFDPATGTYVTRSTQPIVVSVTGAAAPPPEADTHPSPAPAAPGAQAHAAPSASPSDEHAIVAPPNEPVQVLTPLHVALRVAPVLALIALAALVRLLQRGRAEWSLRRSMRRAASRGDFASFLGSAHDLIAQHLSRRWGVPRSEVTARSVRERLGPGGEPLAGVLAARDTVRFARGGPADPSLGRSELGAMCSSIEQSLRGAT
jgi:hypothetical protein